jgi:hypothetical protein
MDKIIKENIRKLRLNPKGLICYSILPSKGNSQSIFRIKKPNIYGISVQQKILKQLNKNDTIILYLNRYHKKKFSKKFEYKCNNVYIGKILNLGRGSVYFKIIKIVYKTNLSWDEFIYKYSSYKKNVLFFKFINISLIPFTSYPVKKNTSTPTSKP